MDDHTLRPIGPNAAAVASRRSVLDAHCALAQVHFDMYGALHIDGLREPAEPLDVAAVWRSVAGRLSSGLRRVGLGALLLLSVGGLGAGEALAQTTLLNVSYDPTRELYREFNEAFNAHWQAEGHQALDIQTSHGGSGSQARAVIDGLEAQVVTLALASDIDAIAAKTGKIPADWQSQAAAQLRALHLDDRVPGARGQPEGHRELGRPDRRRRPGDHPEPEDLGRGALELSRGLGLRRPGVRRRRGADPRLHRQLFQHVPVLDTGARGATTTFAQRGIGDVLLAWENEAFLALEELGEDQFDIVIPSISILAEPTVALVPGNITSDEQGAAAAAYLDYLYSPEGQAIALKHYFRAWDTSEADPADVERFPDSSWCRSPTSAAGRRCSPSTSATAASSTRSTWRSDRASARLAPPVAAAGLPAGVRADDDDAVARRADPDRRA